MRIISYEERYRDDMIFMILSAKDALGRIPGLNEDLLCVKESYLAKGDGFWLALDEAGDPKGRERVVGSVGFSRVPGTDEAYLHRLFIKPDRKRQGIGSALLETAEDGMRAAGIRTVLVHLGSPAEEWYESRAFYRKHGFEFTDPLHMKKEL